MDSVNTTCAAGVSNGVAQMMFVQLLTQLVKEYCALFPSYPDDQSSQIFERDDVKNEQFDFVVVGAGSAGSAIASRLSEEPKWRVLLIEAGSDPPMETNIPSLFPSLMGSKYDWNYVAEKSEKACRGLKNGRSRWTKGKMLGGSSSINLMYYVRGNAKDYDIWEALGNAGWSYANVLKYFKKLENVGTAHSEPQAHGYEGYVHVQQYSDMTLFKFQELQGRLRVAFEELGCPYVADAGAQAKTRSSYTESWGTVENGIRDNTARAYLVPAKQRKNLVILKETVVTKLLVEAETKRVYGVEVNKNGVYKNIGCTKEVVLAAGAVASPQILMLSGIGPKEHLAQMGIPLVQHLDVGYNLQDHLILPGVVVSMNTSQGPFPGTDVMYKYLTRRTELGNPSMKSMAFVDTLGTGEVFPDVQYMFLAIPPQPSPLSLLFFDRVGFSSQMIQWLKEAAASTYLLVIVPVLLRPESRGRITLRSVNPLDPPKIISGYLEDDADVQTLIRGLKFAEKITETSSFANTSSLLYVPLPECEHLAATDAASRSDAFYECFVRNVATTVWHASGTCKMGHSSDIGAVVDPTLKVNGVRGLRVADASIMPRIVSGNTNVPTIMIGEKAADLVKEEWLGKKRSVADEL